MIKFILGVIAGALLAPVFKSLIRIPDRFSGNQGLEQTSEIQNPEIYDLDAGILNPYPDLTHDGILTSSPQDAQRVMLAISEIMKRDGFVSMLDLCELTGNPCTFRDELIGWDDMAHFSIDGVMIQFATPAKYNPSRYSRG
jgi:hypothetical protein